MTANLKQLIRDELVAFAWDDFGLDNVVDADTEWADNLAALIADSVSRRVTEGDVPVHAFLDWNVYGNHCHFPGCRLTYHEHDDKGPTEAVAP